MFSQPWGGAFRAGSLNRRANYVPEVFKQPSRVS